MYDKKIKNKKQKISTLKKNFKKPLKKIITLKKIYILAKNIKIFFPNS